MTFTGTLCTSASVSCSSSITEKGKKRYRRVRRCCIRATFTAITHNTPDGINAASAAALMSHYCLYRLGPKAELGAYLEAHVPGDWSLPWTGKVKSKGYSAGTISRGWRRERRGAPPKGGR